MFAELIHNVDNSVIIYNTYGYPAVQSKDRLCITHHSTSICIFRVIKRSAFDIDEKQSARICSESESIYHIDRGSSQTPRRLLWMEGDESYMPMKLHTARLAVEARVPVSEAVELPI